MRDLAQSNANVTVKFEQRRCRQHIDMLKIIIIIIGEVNCTVEKNNKLEVR